MRATDLGFRSPKERTPASYNPQVTHDGRYLSFSPRQIRGCLIGTEKRFDHYTAYSGQTGFRVGPGTYDNDVLSIQRGNIKGGVRYRPLHQLRDKDSNGYFMVGNHMMYDVRFESKRKQASFSSETYPKSLLSRTSDVLSSKASERPATTLTFHSAKRTHRKTSSLYEPKERNW